MAPLAARRAPHHLSRHRPHWPLPSSLHCLSASSSSCKRNPRLPSPVWRLSKSRMRVVREVAHGWRAR
eukprot:1492800-Prymnesium_polylepis.1